MRAARFTAQPACSLLKRGSRRGSASRLAGVGPGPTPRGSHGSRAYLCAASFPPSHSLYQCHPSSGRTAVRPRPRSCGSERMILSESSAWGSTERLLGPKHCRSQGVHAAYDGLS